MAYEEEIARVIELTDELLAAQDDGEKDRLGRLIDEAIHEVAAAYGVAHKRVLADVQAFAA